MEAVASKNSEDVVQAFLKRNSQGLMVTIKAHPRVEEFMQRLSGGETVAVTSIGRHWLTEWNDPITKQVHKISDAPLRAYALHHTFDPFKTGDGISVDLERVGYPLINHTDGSRSLSGLPEEQLNLSFLRLVGISHPEGVQFLIKSVYSLNGLKKLRDTTLSGLATFVADYIKPVEYCITTSTQVL